jgi:hypothetical protein
MSSALDAIIARGFNVNQPDFRRYTDARDNRRVTDSNLESADVARQINQFNLNESQRQVDQQGMVTSGLADLMQIPNQRAEIEQQQQIAGNNLLNSMNRYVPGGAADGGAPVDGVGPPQPAQQQGVNPALYDQALQMLNDPSVQLDQRQEQIVQQILQNSPEAQALMLENQFGVPERDEPLSPHGKLIDDYDRLRDRDPEHPMLIGLEQEIIDTAAGGNDDPAKIQVAKAYMAASPAERELMQEAWRTQTPFAIYQQGPDGRAIVNKFNRDTSASGAEGAALGRGRVELSAAIPSMNTALKQLKKVRDIISEGKETGRMRQFLTVNDPELQFLEAILNDQVLGKIGSARAEGVTFGAMSEGEWKILGSTVAQMRSKKEANLQILDFYIAKAEKQVLDSQWRFDNWELGGFDPGAIERPPETEVTDPLVDELLGGQ